MSANLTLVTLPCPECGEPVEQYQLRESDPPLSCEECKADALVAAHAAAPCNQEKTMVKIRVANKKHGAAGEYVGRPSPLGNPFSHLEKGTLAQYRVKTREEAVARYEEWLRAKIAQRDPRVCAELNRLWKIARERGELTLVCWCAPQACHADVLKRVLLEKLG